jgi:uncharacterized protein YbjT (DUF2867 family)
MESGKKIAVTGATGRLGRPLVEVLREQGHEVVEIARSHGVDVITGEGLAEALDGVEVVIDAASGPSPDQQEATEFFLTSARNLLEAGERAGVKRIVLVSIVSIERFNSGYNAAKQAQELALLSGPIPVRILRATQFHEFVEAILGWGTQGDVAYVPAMRTQIVAARTVAEELARVATDPSDTPILQQIAGPRAENMVDLARALIARRGDGLRVEVAKDFFGPDELYEEGAALPGPGVKLAGPAFEEWLEASAKATA